MAKALEFLELDFHDPKEVLVAVSYGSVDYRDIGKRKGTFSKTIKMPSTKRNDAFFGYSFDVTNEGFFDNKIRVPITISEIDFDGTLQLKSVEILRGKVSSYDVNIFSDLADWVSLVGEGSIRELTHHESHTLNSDTIKASWTNNGLTGDYVYPLISYGNFLQDRPSTFDIEVAFWRPAFFSLPIIRQIFKEVGYTFIDTGIAKTPLRDHILPFTSKDVAIPEIQINAVGTSTADSFSRNDLKQSTFFRFVTFGYAKEIEDLPSESFDHRSGTFIPPSTDTYEITVKANLQIVSDSLKISGTVEKHGEIALMIAEQTSSGLIGKGFIVNYKPYGSGRKDITTQLTLSGALSVRLDKGKKYRMVYAIIAEPKTDMLLEFTTSNSGFDDHTILIKPKLSNLVTKSEIDHAVFIQNIKKIDLLRDIIAQGNFRIVTDNQKKTVEFVGLNDFLLTETEDWTDKVDQGRATVITQIQNEGAKEIVWSYSNDSDDGFINDASDRFDIDWAEKKVELDSEYRKGVQNIYTSIFSSTIDGSGIGVTLPVMSTQEIKQDEPLPRGTFETGFENRCLIYGGLQPGVFVINSEQQSLYPYAFFTSGDFSLQWKSMSELVEGSTDIGLIDRFYPITINQLNNSKMAAFWMNLNELDISTLSFRKIKIVDGNHYYLNLVSDYIVNNNQPTKVELISR